MHAQESILSNHQLGSPHFEVFDHTPKAVDLVQNLPSRAALAVAPLAKLFNIPMISWAATLVELSDEKRFPTMSRVIGSALK
uniref:Receptor ligand binding region domain-containing protein n=1 Tax=Romanomermis culicivorax TaxID=13658 RepID=A0A915L7W6_ROMCU